MQKLFEGSYKTIDYLCNIPDLCLFPYPAPMHSYIAYILMKFFGISLYQNRKRIIANSYQEPP